MSSNVKFSFFLTSRKNPKNEHPIVMTITMGYDRTQYYTGVWIKKNRWNDRTNKVRGRDPESVILNDSLLSLQSHGRQVTNELIMSGRPFNPKTIKDKMKNGFSNNLGVVKSFENFLIRMEQQIPLKYTRSTLVKYINTKNRIQEFIKKSTQRNDIYLYELNDEFLEDFEVFLNKTYNVQHNTIYKSYQRFTRFVRYEVSQGNLKKYPFPEYKIKMIQKQGHYLTFDDIQKLENFEFDLPRLLMVKHLFLFSIYTGLSYIDLCNLKESDIYTDDDGMNWVKTYRQKSKSRVSVPLITNSIKSLNVLRSGKFPINEGKLLPSKNNSRVNFELKQICEVSGVSTPEKVTFHSGRRSTSSIMMKMGVPLEVLQKVLSHKSLSTSLMYYTHVEDKYVGEQMKILEKKLDSRK